MRFFLLVTTLLGFLTLLATSGSANQVQAPLALPSQMQNTPQAQQSPLVQLEDIAGPVFIEEQLPWLMIISLIVITIIVSALGYFFVKKLRKAKPQAVPPSSRALKRLDQHRSQFSRDGEDRVYIADIIQTLRQYIEEEFQLQPTSQTTEEFLQSLNKPATITEVNTLVSSHKDQLKELLELSDKAKFAHKPLNEQELEHLHQLAHSIILSSSVIKPPEPGRVT